MIGREEAAEFDYGAEDDEDDDEEDDESDSYDPVDGEEPMHMAANATR